MPRQGRRPNVCRWWRAGASADGSRQPPTHRITTRRPTCSIAVIAPYSTRYAERRRESCNIMLHSVSNCCRNKGEVMAEALDRVTRVAADLVDSAAAEGARQSRSAKQQLDHWARVGRAVSSQHTATRRRVEAALAGHLATSELTVEEGVVFNAEISAAVEESLARTNYGAALAGQGITTVALNDAGEIVEHQPDGTEVVLATRR